MSIPLKSQWSEVGPLVAAAAGSCNCPRNEKTREYPPAGREVIRGISRLICSACGKHRVESSTR